MVTEIPLMIEKTNGGKGIPLSFTLTPIDKLLKMFKLQSQMDCLSYAIDEATVKTCFQVEDDIKSAYRKLHEYINDFKRMENFIPDEKRNQIKDLVSDLDIAVANYRKNLGEALVKARSDIAHLSSVNELLASFQKDHLSPGGTCGQLAKFWSFYGR